MHIKDFSESKWENLYRSYKERYMKQSGKTPMMEMSSLSMFKANYVAITNMEPQKGTSQVLNAIVHSQKDILSRKQQHALANNLIKGEYVGSETINEFLKDTGFGDLKTDYARHQWTVRYGKAF